MQSCSIEPSSIGSMPADQLTECQWTAYPLMLVLLAMPTQLCSFSLAETGEGADVVEAAAVPCRACAHVPQQTRAS